MTVLVPDPTLPTGTPGGAGPEPTSGPITNTTGRVTPAKVTPAKVTTARVVRAEWIKFRTVRSNLVGLVSAGVMTVGLGLLFSSLAGSNDGPPNLASDALSISLGGVNLAQIVIAVLGVAFVTSEYTSGLIRTMFGAVPGRLQVLAAKAGVAAAATTVVMLVASVVAFLGGRAVYGGDPAAVLSLGDDGVIRALIGTALYLGGIAAMGVALGFLLRSAGSAIGVVVSTLLVAPILIGLLPSGIADPVGKVLPSNAGAAFRAVGQSASLLTPAEGAVVFGLWVLGLLALAAVVVRRRDA